MSAIKSLFLLSGKAMDTGDFWNYEKAVAGIEIN